MNILDTEEGKELVQKVAIGLDAERFLSSEFGGFLYDRLVSQRQIALGMLEEVDPSDTEVVRKIQNEAYVPKMILQTIDDAFESYKLAKERLQQPAE